MKNLLLLSTLTLSLCFSAGSWAEWTEVDMTGLEITNTIYVDFDGIRKGNGFIYYWKITDYLEPGSDGVFSDKTYAKVDCEILRESDLSYSTYKLPMAEGTAEGTYDNRLVFHSARPNSPRGRILEAVCAH
jgi:hypothetical protein